MKKILLKLSLTLSIALTVSCFNPALLQKAFALSAGSLFYSDYDDSYFSRYHIADGRRIDAVLSSGETFFSDISLNSVSVPEVSASYVPNDPYYSSSTGLVYDLSDAWWLHALDIENAWEYTKGGGVTIAIIDSGISFDNPDLAANVWYNEAELGGLTGVDDDGNGYVDDIRGWDFENNDNDPLDDDGHGTHLAGILGAVGGNNYGIIGVAPESNIMAVKVLDQTGAGYWSNVILGIKYAADMGAQVINLSLGADVSYVPVNDLHDAILYARSKGSFVVAAAGNDGADIAQMAPAFFDEVISVGALTPPYYNLTPLQRASYSNYGDELDFMAPGSKVLSLAGDGNFVYAGSPVPKDGVYWPSDPDFSIASGTSMATPMVSGLVALMLSVDPLLSFDDIYRRLKFSSQDMGANGFDVYYGYGAIDAYKAISHDYYDNGALKTYWLFAPDAFGVIEYDYDQAGNVMGKMASFSTYFRFVEFWPATALIKSEEFYDTQGIWQRTVYYQTDGVTVINEIVPAGGDLYHYDRFRRLVKKEMSSGDVFDYYLTGNLKSFYEASTGITYEYLDENWSGDHVGRLAKRINPDGSEARYLAYWPGTDKVKIERRYDAAGALVAHYAYFSSGNRSSYYNTLTGVTEEYLDENYFGNGVGRFSKIIYPDFTEDRFTYWSTTGARKSRTVFKRGAYLSLIHQYLYDLIGSYSYYESGNLSYYFNYAGNFYVIQYLDENFYGDGTGRKSSEDYGDWDYKYVSYWNGTDVVRIKEVYYKNALTDIYTYLPDGTEEHHYVITGGEQYIYSSGTIYKILYPGGVESRYLEYWPGTNQVKVEEKYQSGVLMGVYTYYLGGALESQTNYQAGKPTSSSSYYESGKTRSVGQYKSGFLVTVLIYYESGVLQYTEKYDKSVLVQKTGYYQDSKIKSSLKYDKQGKLSEQILYYQNGFKQLQESYKNGFLSERTTTYENGKTQLKDKYKDGVLIERSTYYENGKTQLKEKYTTGGVLIERFAYYASGRLKSSFKAGITTTYYESGNEKSWTTLNGSGYERYDEIFAGKPKGRYSKTINADGSFSTYDAYWTGTDKAKFKSNYDPSGSLIVTYEYDVYGVQINAVYPQPLQQSLKASSVITPEYDSYLGMRAAKAAEVGARTYPMVGSDGKFDALSK